MKPLLVFVIGLLFSLPALAAGPNDGVYSSDIGEPGWSLIHQSGDAVVMVNLDGDYTWEALQGIRDGNVALLSVVAAEQEGSATVELEFVSDVEIRATLLSCTPGLGVVCNEEAGAEFQLLKIF